MMDYIIYGDIEQNGDFIVEMLNSGDEELKRVEMELLKKGFIIDIVNGVHIHCHNYDYYKPKYPCEEAKEDD